MGDNYYLMQLLERLICEGIVYCWSDVLKPVGRFGWGCEMLLGVGEWNKKFEIEVRKRG